ncbi:MAG: FecR domain-containing protein, partial [Saprospiraceae bacterium]
GETVTEVVGTSFNIKQAGSKTEIFVSEGKVIFRSKDDKESALALTSGEAAVFDNVQIERLVNPSPNMQAWHSKQIDLSGMPIAEMISDISRYFNREITIENEGVKDCKLSGSLSFKEPKIENVLAVIALTINADVEMDGDKCILRGGKCP